jgi:arginase
MHLDAESGVRNADAIARFAGTQATLLERVVREGAFPLVLGGDCSILIGNALGLKRVGRYGLFFLDGHTDFMGPDMSQTGGAAGMDLAIVTGHAHPKLAGIGGAESYVREEDVWCVGNREYDPSYVAVIQGSGIHYTDLASLRATGAGACVTGFLQMVAAHALDGFWIHVDLDVLDDRIMPAVDSRQDDGLSYAELEDVLGPLLAHPLATGMEVTILDPDLDPQGGYTRAFVEVFTGIVNRARRPA